MTGEQLTRSVQATSISHYKANKPIQLNKPRNFVLVLSVLLASALVSSLDASAALTIEEQWVGNTPPNPNSYRTLIDEASTWSTTFDNDILVPGSRDQDYTYGANITFSGKEAAKHWVSTHKPLAALDNAIGITSEHGARRIEYGLIGFTPENISENAVLVNDRPYASLIYSASTNEYYDFDRHSAWISTLTIGALGLNVVGEIQKGVHEVTEGTAPHGWGHQISSGGEPTARFSLARQQLLFKSSEHAEVKTSAQLSLGYITEFNVSIGGRFGQLRSPWMAFRPELASYGETSAPANRSKLFEHYLWAGVSLKARAYNAFLQGQFRDSEHELDSSELNHGIVEAWIGYTLGFENGYRLSYALRGHTSEINHGEADRAVVWGGIQLAKTFCQ